MGRMHACNVHFKEFRLHALASVDNDVYVWDHTLDSTTSVCVHECVCVHVCACHVPFKLECGARMIYGLRASVRPS